MSELEKLKKKIANDDFEGIIVEAKFNGRDIVINYRLPSQEMGIEMYTRPKRYYDLFHKFFDVEDLSLI